MDDPARTHAVHASLQQLEALSESSQLSDANEEIDDLRRRSLDRIFYLAAETRKRLSKLKGVRANLSVFTNIQNSVQSIRQELENYISNKNAAHIDGALNQADQGLAIYLSQLPAGSPAADAETALESFRKSSRSAVGELKANEGILKQQIGNLQQTISEQEERVKVAQAEINTSKQELANKLSSIDANFEALKGSIESSFSNLRDGQRASLKRI